MTIPTPFPIDAVLPWVDGGDPALAAKAARYAGKGMLENDEIAGPARYASVGEIRWTVASMLRYAPFLRKIFIVTDGQDPDLGGMLREYFPDRMDDVVIVDHSVIFRGREAYLPTFNSRSIDTLIWNIPDLSEHFIYSNDDVMLTRPVSPEDFFRDGKVVCYARRYPAALVRLWRFLRPRHVGFKEAMLRTLELVGGGRHILYFGHTPRPALKSWFERWAQERPDMVERNLKYKFRNVDQFQVQEAFCLDMERQGRMLLVPAREAGLLIRHGIKSAGNVDRRLACFRKDGTRKFVCFNSLSQYSPKARQRVADWLDGQVFGGLQAPSPVDVVLPWVDGGDPVLAAKRAKYAGTVTLENNEVGGPARYTSFGEIRWTVASILRFAPFVRKIFIVTDGQDPDLGGMLREHFPDRADDVVIVDHSVIFRSREAYLPTFNSNSIDTLIWNIPDLSEHYLYMNDDEMLIRPVSVEDFFPDGKVVCYAHRYSAALVRLWRLLRPKHVGYKEAMLRALELMGGRGHILYLGHTPCPMLKSWSQRWAQERPDMIERNLKYKFRDVAQFEVQEAFYVDMEHRGRMVLVSDLEAGLVLKHHKMTDEYVDEKLALFSADKTRKFVCFNSLDGCSPEAQKRIAAWLDARIFDL